MSARRKTFEERLERFVIPEPNSGCWLWTGAVVSDGYGTISIDGKHRLAHRYSYEYFKGPIPDKMFVCHSCDIPSCINPDHLSLGTPKDNIQDSLKKNRFVVGERCKNTKITDEQALDIKSGRISRHEFAELYGITYQTASNIASGRSWKHIQTG